MMGDDPGDAMKATMTMMTTTSMRVRRATGDGWRRQVTIGGEQRASGAGGECRAAAAMSAGDGRGRRRRCGVGGVRGRVGRVQRPEDGE